MSREITLHIGGNKYKGWQEVSVSKAVSALCGSFQVSLVDTDFENKANWSLTMGSECTLYLEDQLLITGFIEDINIGYDKETHSIAVAGRDQLGDLVDCHRSFDQSREWLDQTILSIVKSLCAPFGFTVVADSIVASIVTKREAQYGFNEGDTVFETISRLCRKHYIIPMSLGDGKLLLARSGSSYSKDRLQTGYNILRGALTRSNRERFSDYYAKGFSFGFDEKTVNDYVHPKGQATDPIITRYRPYALMEDTNTSFGDCNASAKAEAALRAGNSYSYEFEVPEWVQSNGVLWQINQLIQVVDPILAVDEVLLIDQLQFNQSDAGQTTTIQVCSPEKYKAEADLANTKTELDILAQLGI